MISYHTIGVISCSICHITGITYLKQVPVLSKSYADLAISVLNDYFVNIHTLCTIYICLLCVII